ncbi:MAG TPA: exodeoxyribonuclease VII small subunit [Gemmatimonadaceae bacterium]
MAFEQDVERLEQIVASLESDELTLDGALALFQEGVDRLRAAAAELSKAEAQVKLLVEQSDGTFSLDEFDE